MDVKTILDTVVGHKAIFVSTLPEKTPIYSRVRRGKGVIVNI